MNAVSTRSADGRTTANSASADSSEPSGVEESRSPVPDWMVLGLAAPIGLALAFLVRLARDVDPFVAVEIGVAVGALGLAVMSFIRMRWFLIAVLVLRPALDDLVFDELELFQPGSTIGLLVLVVGGVWLLDRLRSGRLESVSKLSIAFFLYATAITLSAPGSITPFLSFTGSLKVWSVAVFFMVLEQVFRREPHAIWQFLAAGAVGLIIPIATAIVQAVSTGTVDPVSGLVRIDGPFVHPNPFATYLVVAALIAAPVFLRYGGAKRFFAGLVFVSCVGIIVLTYARAGWGSLVLGLIVIGMRLDRRLLVSLAIAAVLVVLVNPSTVTRLADLAAPDDPTITYENPNSMEWRVGYWVEVLPLAGSNPVTGIGLDTVEQVTSVGLPPHNSFVQAFVEAGVIGLSGLLLVVLAAWRLLGRSLSLSLDREHTVISTAAAAAALSVFLQLFTENLVTGVTPIMYMLVPVAWLSATELNRAVRPTPEVDRLTQEMAS